MNWPYRENGRGNNQRGIATQNAVSGNLPGDEIPESTYSTARHHIR